MLRALRPYWIVLALLLGAPQVALAHGHHAQHREPTEIGVVNVAELPPEGRNTLSLIKQGGPFPYERDGVVFGNFERTLPRQARGYYHEYTVKTPGARNRGARRIISGEAHEYYYTADHYQTFKRIRE